MKEILYSQFLDTLLEICPINEETKSLLYPYLNSQKLPKGTHLLSIGEISDKVFYIGKGLIRSYYFLDEKEVTGWIAAEGEFVSSIYSFLREKPSFENIELLEDSQLLFISYSDLQQLYYTHPIANRIGRILSEKYLLISDERIRSLRMLKAEERYYRFCLQYPSICTRAPLKHIASYLGLSRFTLSRLRGQKIKLDLLP
ncbi:Crp/Fnr family transcriptional regulator [Larkinella knui]|uniref:Crp/Fnr family transcriptional regulator n=1 Tax=Larkinella knui TaxID=2025310 RepID=A0A3P1CIR2_9BACT|nr:Crp/Fnr family transcriptional regulator [Larkinella knui]RRB12784.1 Crp/Fnr family transcriptional regulator [Larkinella knui]